MEKAITPEMRKWISPLFHVETEVKELVRRLYKSVLRPLTPPPEETAAPSDADGQIPSTSNALHVPKGIKGKSNFDKLMEDLGKTDDDYGSGGEDSEDDEEEEDDLVDKRRKSGVVKNEEIDSDSEDEPRDVPLPISFLDGRVEKGDDDRDSDEEEEDVVKQISKPLEQWLSIGAKSGPHRLLSNDEKFKPFMKRAYEIKIKREDAHAEPYKDIMMKRLGIDEETFKIFQARTSVSAGTVYGEAFKDDPIVEGTDMPVLIPPVPDADKLELKSMSVMFCSTNTTGMLWRSSNVQQQINDNLHYVAVQEGLRQRKIDYAAKKPGLVDQKKDFLIEVSVFIGRHPRGSLPADVKINAEPKLCYKLELLGRNTVADLRNALHCDQDFISLTEVENPDEAVDLDMDDIVKYKMPASILLIHDVMYRHGGSIDFGKFLKEWAAQSPPKEVGEFSAGNSNTRLKDLTLRLGFPYVYIHAGKCEHILVFNTIRLMQEEDEHRIDRYPRISTIPTAKSVHCKVDNENMATWRVVDCSSFPENPMLVCSWCLKTFCYNEDGTKQVPFKLFPYRQLANEI